MHKKIEVLMNYTLKYLCNLLWFLINAYDKARLRNDKFTILCSNCIGGIIYHRLNKSFLSPTINLWMSENDLIKFCENIDYYLNETLKFEDNYNYPIANLGDIKLHFNHYANDNEAMKKWNERKKRINKNNIFIITSDNGAIDEVEERLKKLKCIKCKGKIMLTSHINDKDSLIIPKYKDCPNVGMYMFDKSKLDIYPFDCVFDYVYFFNHGMIKKYKGLREYILEFLFKL